MNALSHAGTSRPGRLNVRLALAVVSALLLALSACGSDTSDDNSDSAEGGKKLKIGILVEASGPYGPVFKPAADGAQSVLKAANKDGGINGYTFSSKIYDSSSTAAGGDAAVRAAINDKVDAIVAVSQFMDGAIPLLQEANIPVFGYGVSPNWYGEDKTNMFSYTGDIVFTASTALLGLAKADGRTDIGVIADPSPGSTAGGKNWASMVEATPGYKLSMTNFDLNSQDVAGITSIAQQFIDAGATAILSTAGGGTVALQAALNQLGADVRALTPAESGQAVLDQFGDSANGLVYWTWMATQEHDLPGWADYKKVMTDAGFKKNITTSYAPQGYVNAKLLLEAISAVQGDVSSASIIETANADWSASDVGGLIKAPTWPAAHTQQFAGVSASEVKDGKWVAYGDTTFMDGEPFTSK